MNVVKMPGFTAGASFSKTRGHYRFAAGGISRSGLVPQLNDSDIPGATCGKDRICGNVICVQCTSGNARRTCVTRTGTTVNKHPGSTGHWRSDRSRGQQIYFAVTSNGNSAVTSIARYVKNISKDNDRPTRADIYGCN